MHCRPSPQKLLNAPGHSLRPLRWGAKTHAVGRHQLPRVPLSPTSPHLRGECSLEPPV